MASDKPVSKTDPEEEIISQSEEENISDDEEESSSDEEENSSDEEESTSDEEENSFLNSVDDLTDENISNLEGYYRSEEYQSGLSDSTDYSGYFENLQSIGVLIFCLLFGFSLAICFISGFRKNE